MAEVAGAVAESTEVELTEAEQASAEELAGFEAAIEGVSLPKSEEVKEDEPEVAQEVKEEPVKEQPKANEPQLAQVTSDQLRDLLATATSVKELSEGLKKLRDDAYGKIGGIERLIKQVEKSTDSGLDLTLTDEDFKEVNDEVPMLTKPLQKLMDKILKTAKVKVPSVEPVDIESVRTQLTQEFEDKMQKARVEDYQLRQREQLTDRFPDWQETVVKPEFHSWLSAEDKLSPGYQDRFLSSWNAREIGGVLKKFNAHMDAEKAKTQNPPSKPKPKVATPSNDRKERLKEAIPPKAASSTPKPKGPMTEEEAFESVG